MESVNFYRNFKKVVEEETSLKVCEVSWHDNSRDFASCYGTNITDVVAFDKDGRMLSVARHDNYHDPSMIVKTEDISFLKPVNFQETTTLKKYLDSIGFGKSTKATYRHQAFVLHSPPPCSEKGGLGRSGPVEFFFGANCYSAKNGEPSNLLILATPNSTLVTTDSTIHGEIYTRLGQLKEETLPEEWGQIYKFLVEPTELIPSTERQDKSKCSGDINSVCIGLRKEFEREGDVCNKSLLISVPIVRKTGMVMRRGFGADVNEI